MTFQTSLVWLRRDIRLEDNKALHDACQSSQNVILVFVFDTNILNKISNKKDKRVYFIYQSLLELNEFLEKQGKSLYVVYGNPIEEIPKIGKTFKIQCVYANKDYEPSAIERDEKVKLQLQQIGIEFKLCKDQVIFEENEVLKKDNKPYTVFTPYKNQWVKQFSQNNLIKYTYNIQKIVNKEELKNNVFPWNIAAIHFKPTDIYVQPGRKNALNYLEKFAKKINDYDTNRDFFHLSGTSFLSMHLRFGTLSIREAFAFSDKFLSKGAEVWRNELIWREFYKMILYHFPYAARSTFKKEYSKLHWDSNEEYFDRWKNGMTGFPVIDAAMRCFKETGWMHNRLRMIVASFLTKDLLLDYKKGEQYFAENLLDFDLSSNNGGWQWSASTGCDAQPYFRVFNPESQSIKFDPSGKFIRQYCPELINCDDKQIHAPFKYSNSLFALNLKYPKPIVEHDAQRLKVIKLFKLNKH
ncbi:deoxyribodipyrimidine photo-lyase [Pigmentibacter sp. JX0631]|uniref:cryptochrome/photolyase family protein n=1 Tax=Pigmentibacter sp. JX0631 TaxID=2976982 RepID=UPI002469717D|nr:deoxyribodipyrimidine photo-lyase [Pigmentibacter sp. JX0631]WGL59530.1 deoxyribodipyrimidine photo-lyase [Pigmentibacter sp. JX0631]